MTKMKMFQQSSKILLHREEERRSMRDAEAKGID
jgi:hypothetical protein